MKLRPALASFPSLESSILISPACSGVHPYFSSAIHNSKQELGKKEKGEEWRKHPQGLIFYHKWTISCCAFWPARASVESSITASDDCCMVGNRCLPVICFGHCCYKELWQRWTVRFLPGVSACRVTNWRFLWACDSVKTRVVATDVPGVTFFFCLSLGVNHQGNLPLIELPSVIMCPSRSPSATW